MADHDGARRSDRALAVPAEPASGLDPSGFDPSRVRAWLVSMTRQGEDNVWRGAEKALACFDALAAEIAQLKQPRFGEPGYKPPPPALHAYNPHPKYPWFCDDCGYAEHERLQHPARDSDGSPKGGDGVAGSVHDSAAIAQTQSEV